MLLVGLGVDELVQLVPHPLGGRPDFPPDGRQRRGGVVRHLFLVDDAGEDFLLQVLVGGQHLKPGGEGGGDVAAFTPPLGQAPDGPQGGADVQQLPKAQPAPRLGAAQGVGDVLHAVEGGRAVLGHGHKGGVRLPQKPLGLGGGVDRLQLPGQLGAVLAGALLGHHL